MSDMIDPDERDLAERTAAGCECPVNDSDACIAGTVYVPCDNENCGGVCEMAGTCGFPLHADPLHEKIAAAVARLNAASIPPMMTEAQFNATTITDARRILLGSASSPVEGGN